MKRAPFHLILEKNKVLVILGCTVVFIASYYYFKLKLGEVLAIMGASFAFVQTSLAMDTAREGKLANLQENCEKQIAAIAAESDKKDAIHEQLLTQIQLKISELELRLSAHNGQPGHESMINQMITLKDQVSELKAIMAVLTKQGEFDLKLINIKKQLREVVDSFNSGEAIT